MSLFAAPDPHSALADLCSEGIPSAEARRMAYSGTKRYVAMLDDHDLHEDAPHCAATRPSCPPDGETIAEARK